MGVRWLIASLVLVWLFDSTNAAAEGSILEPAVPTERELAAGETHAYRLELTGDGVWKVSVEQLGVDVELTLVPADGERVVTDSPLDRAGTESLVLRSSDVSGFQVEVHARERAAPSGSYRILLEQLAESSATDKARLAAETTRMDAARSYAQGATSRPEALELYRKAVVHWRAAGSDYQETRDLYCIVVLQRLVGETRVALEAARGVLLRWQQLGDRYWEAATLNEIGLLLWHVEESQEARELFRRALKLQEALGDRFNAATTRNNICISYLKQGQLRAGLDCYQPLLNDLNNGEEPQLFANVLTNVGWANDTLGEPVAAFEAYRRALELGRETDDLLGTARTLNNLGLLHRKTGDFEEALASYERSLDLFQGLQDLRWQGLVLNNIGHTYALLGEPQRALIFFEQALGLLRRIGDRRFEVWTLTNIGAANRSLGEIQSALGSHRSALALSQEIGDPRLEATTLTTLGWVELERGNHRQALDLGTRAIEIVGDSQAPATEANALHLIGRALRLEGDARGAVAKLKAALSLRKEIRFQDGEAASLIELARAERELGQIERARSHVEAALRAIEGLRTRVSTADLRAMFQSSRRDAYELYIDLLMTLHHERPNADHDLEALEASELTRARALLDLLVEAGAEIYQGVAPSLRERRNAAGRHLNAKAARRSAVLAGEPTDEAREEIEREMASALYELDRIEAEIRRRSPRYAALTLPRPLAAREIQGLLDADSLLLEYALGEERSFLWLVSLDQVQSFELPGRQTIEDAARRFHELLSQPGAADRKAQAMVASALSEMLLGPVGEQLDGTPSAGTRRLVVVADGALHYLPFGALPIPAAKTMPLLARHEVVYLPSASVLAEQRRRLAARHPPRGELAVVADPVFEIEDPRLSGLKVANLAQPKEESGLRSPIAKSWRRLPGSRREAEAILALVPPEQSLAAMGFEANRAAVMDDRLSRHRVVHFATHGLIDTSNPRLSGLVLSLFDEAGQPRDGFLRAHDVFNLNLAADLVVLSGCQTALGREVRGEGLLGLTRGFMYAGAPRVVASLWRVEDRATAELMSRFYHSMQVEGVAPAAALRAAQLSILGKRRWQDPYYWSAFVMQGDWLATASRP